MKTYFGIDNGVSGSLGIITPKHQTLFFSLPTFKQQSYTKKKQQISRIDPVRLRKILEEHSGPRLAIVERPMINPTRFTASISAARALEVVQSLLDIMQTPYQFVDSKEWQKALLPRGAKGPELKQASLDLGCRLFPEHVATITKHKDADGLLMAEWARRNQL